VKGVLATIIAARCGDTCTVVELLSQIAFDDVVACGINDRIQCGIQKSENAEQRENTEINFYHLKNTRTKTNSLV